MFDVARGSSCGLFVRVVELVVHLFGFVAFEKRFHRCIVVTVAAPTHALNDLVVAESTPKRRAGVLAAPVAVNDQARLGTSRPGWGPRNVIAWSSDLIASSESMLRLVFQPMIFRECRSTIAQR